MLENLNKREIIYNKITYTGNIVLSKPFNNYKKIIVEASNDELTTFTYTTLYTDEIVFNKNFTLMQGDGKFWYGKFTSYTNFNTTSENSVIHKIVGVNY